MPLKARTGIGFAPRRNITVADHRFNRIAATQVGKQLVERQVLGILEGKLVTTLEFDADGEVVAILSTQPGRNTGMPGTAGAGNELDQFAVTANKEMGRNPQVLYFTKIVMRLGIETIGKQLNDSRSAEFAGRQTDGVDDDQSDRFIRGPLITVQRWHPTRAGQPPLVARRVLHLIHSFIPSRAIR